MKKGMIALFGALFLVTTFVGAGMASGDGDDRYERGERYERDDDRYEREERYERDDDRYEREERHERDDDRYERGERYEDERGEYRERREDRD